MTGNATISPDGKYRYLLRREYEEDMLGTVLFVMLNPSTADATKDDATIRRCFGFIKRWGYSTLEVVNLFAFRATHPRDLWKAEHPVGPDNDATIRLAVHRASLIVAAWGVCLYPGRATDMLRVLKPTGKLHVLKFTKEGFPHHPLRLPNDTALVKWL